MGALLMVMTGLTVPVAHGATASWEFDHSGFYFAPAPYGSGPTEPHVFTLTNTGETQLAAKTWGFRLDGRRSPPGSARGLGFR